MRQCHRRWMGLSDPFQDARRVTDRRSYPGQIVSKPLRSAENSSVVNPDLILLQVFIVQRIPVYICRIMVNVRILNIFPKSIKGTCLMFLQRISRTKIAVTGSLSEESRPLQAERIILISMNNVRSKTAFLFIRLPLKKRPHNTRAQQFPVNIRLTYRILPY